MSMPPNPLLEDQLADPLWERFLHSSTDDLARASRPDFLGDEPTPLQWTAADWDRLEAERRDIFDWDKLEAQFDRDVYLRDGYAVLRGIVPPSVIATWTEALQYGQQRNDALLQADWSLIDWRTLGCRPPECQLSAEAIASALGGSQKAPQRTDEAGVLTLRRHSVFTEYFPAGHVPFLMDVLTHPQMLHLQKLCLGTEAVYFDHNQLLTRPPGYAGGSWHSHKIGAGYDCDPVQDVAEYQAQPNTNLTLCYPQGFSAADDGGLKLIRGSHLFRDPDNCRAATDDEIEAGWLKGRVHPITGRPLAIEHLELPPGSVVCCLSHGAHGVAAKGADKETRWCTLYAYKKADDRTGLVQPPHAVPPLWALKAQRGELPPVLTELMRPSFDRTLTGGRTEPYQN